MNCKGKYSEYNIIPIGDHCAIAIILKELNLRKNSYPFDWVTKLDHLYDTNIIYNIQLINEINLSDNVDDIVKKYIGNAFLTEFQEIAIRLSYPVAIILFIWIVKASA